MGIDPVTIGIIGLGISAVGFVQQQSAASDAKRAAASSAAEQRKQFEAQQRVADIQNARTRANTARQARIARGSLSALGANTGTSQSSGVAGGLAALSTQAAGELGTFGAIASNQVDVISSQSRQAGFAADQISAQANVSSAQGVFSLGSTIFDKAGGAKLLFDTTKPKTS